MDLTAVPRQLARTQRFTLGVPRSFTVAPDGAAVVFLRTRSGEDPVSCLWLIENGRERLLVDPDQLGWVEDVPELERERRDMSQERSKGIVSYSADAGVGQVVFALDGGLWLVQLEGGGPRPLPCRQPAVFPKLDPTGQRVAYVSAGALHVLDLAGEAELLALEPEAADVSYGLPDDVGMLSWEGFWWAPDGSALLVTRVDKASVERVWISDPSNPQRPPRQIAYPLAGTANAEVSLHVVRLDGSRRELSWDRTAFEYVVIACWDTHGPMFSVQNRDQRRLQVLAGDAETGATQLIWEEADGAWVQRIPGSPLRTESGRLVHSVDIGATRHLAVDGSAVSPEGLQVKELLAAAGETVLFVASSDPTEEHVWSYEPGSGARALTGEPGIHRVFGSGNVRVRSSHTEAGRRFALSSDEGPEVEIACHEAEPLVTPKVSWLRLGARDLRGVLVLPSWYEGGHSLPVLLSPYGGPALQRVTRARHWHLSEAQWFADQGMAVLAVDGSGTPGRGPVWEKEILGDSLSTVLADQVDALQATAELYPDLDLSRVGIRGWSFGGTLAAAGVLRRPDVFRCAISGAAPSDVAMYFTHYRERFLGQPQDNPDGYRNGSTLCEAAGLERPLLLVHGMADSNVLVAHTLRMSAALFAAGRHHELLLLPGFTHMTTDESAATELLLRQLDFLVRNLGLEGAVPS
jgi:dipeptidyl-peptidase-4